MNSTPSGAVSPTTPDLKILATILGDSHRWLMLRELSCGEPREIVELARAGGCSYMAAMRHVTRMFRAGILVRNRGRTYQLAPQYRPTATQPLMDFGHCLIRPMAGK